MSHNADGARHWGKWVRARSRHVGFLSAPTLAKAVGCTADRATRWMLMRRPPLHMRKGFDAALAAALRVDQRTLFTEYASVDPTAEPEGAAEPANAA